MAWIPTAGDSGQMAVEDQQEPDTSMLSFFQALRQGATSTTSSTTSAQIGFSNGSVMAGEENENNDNDNDDDEDINESGGPPGSNEPEQNTMEIKVDSKVYASGDMVTGSVVLNVVHPFLAKGVLVCLHGSEKVHYQTTPNVLTQSGNSSRRYGSVSPLLDSSNGSIRPTQLAGSTGSARADSAGALGGPVPSMGYGRICLPFQKMQNLNSLNDIVSSPLSGSPMSSYQGYSNSNSNNGSNGSVPNTSALGSSSTTCIVTPASSMTAIHVPSGAGDHGLAASCTQNATSSLPSLNNANSSDKNRSMPYTTPQQSQNPNPSQRKERQKIDPQIREARGANDVLKKIEKVHSFEGVYMPGVYTFPFRCMLPPDLPASCELRGGDWERGTGYSAKTSYKVFGYIEGIIGKKLKGAGKFVVTERLPPEAKAPVVTETKEVQSKAALSVSCRLNKAEYMPGERVLLGLTAKSMTKSSTGRVILSLVHEVTLNTLPSTSQQQQRDHHSKHSQSSQQFQSQQMQQMQQQQQQQQQMEVEGDKKKEVSRIAYSEVSHYEMQPIGPYYYGVKWVGFDLPKQLFSLKDAAEEMETGEPVISVSSRCGTLFKSRHYIRVHCNIAPGVTMRFNLPFNISINTVSEGGGYDDRLSSQQQQQMGLVEIPRDVTYRGLWQQNEDCSQCNGCGSKLMLWLRKHHCRNCGKIYCNSCSSKKLPIPAKKYMEPVRVCDACYASIIRNNGANAMQKYDANNNNNNNNNNNEISPNTDLIQSDYAMLSDDE